MRDISDKLPNVLDFEFGTYLLRSVFCLLSKTLVDEFDHLFKAVFEIGLELLKCFVGASFEFVAQSGLKSHGSQCKSAFADTFVISCSKG